MSRIGRGLTPVSAGIALVVLGVDPAYADSNGDFLQPDPGGGIPGWFVGLFVLIVVLGVGTTIWRVTTAQKLAKQSGMDAGLATQMTLLSEDGLDATYLASSLRQQQTPPSPASPPAEPTPAAERLVELGNLLDRGLVTQAEYDERRKAIIDSV
jgi:hypothetical protein